MPIKDKAERSAWQREYYQANREKRLAYYHANKEAHAVRHRAWRKANPDCIRCKIDPQHKLAKLLRKRIAGALRGNWKGGSAVHDLGCSIAKFKAHIEAKFQPGMTWDNWGRGKGKWHLDHIIIPLSAWNLQDRSQFLRACHYTNYQPLWGVDNVKKHAKWV